MCGRVVDMHLSSFSPSSSTKSFRDERQPKDHSPSPLSASEDDDTGSSVGHPVVKKDSKERDDSQLTVQALNTDGTPRRPMNAFMIFARRRRPQVSAENSLLRTGEISKILSKEWTTMPMAEKQFYLDQAKRLKDTFNSKYPDYVYRRRPNNSRKKRKPDAALSPSLDAAASGDAPEGSSDAYNFEYPSPESEVLGMPSLRAIGLSTRFDHRVGVASDYEDSVGPSSAHPSTSPYAHPGHDYNLTRFDQHSSRVLPDPISAGRPAPQTSPFSLLPHQHLDDQHPYTPPHAHQFPSHSHHSPASYSPELFAGPGSWGQAPSSLGGAHGPNATHGYAGSRERTLTALQIKSEDRSPPPQRPWSTSMASPSTSSSMSSHVSHSSGYSLHTLSSPFYPQAPPHSGTYPHQPPTPTSSTPSTSPETYFAPPIPPSSEPYESRGAYDDAVTDYGSSSSGTLHHYSHEHPHGSLHTSRSASSLALSRSLPSPHAHASSANPYTLQSLSSASRLSSFPGSGDGAYTSWDRDRIDDR